MTREDCLTLEKILARKNSPFAGEREAAERLARAFLAKRARPAPAAAPVARQIAQAALPAPLAQPRTERRRSHRRDWRGYCRRRSATTGAAMNLAA